MIHDISALSFGPDCVDDLETYSGAPMRPANSDPFAKYKRGPADPLIGFAENTLILTSEGARAVQDILPGMLVHTRDHGLRVVRWSGRTDRAASRELQPIVIPQGALGNDSTLRVASHQGLLFTEWRAAMFFGEPEVLVAAKGLVGMSGIYCQKGARARFYQIMLDQHALIRTNGAWTESLHPSDVAPLQFGQTAARDVASLQLAAGATDPKVMAALSCVEARVLQAA